MSELRVGVIGGSGLGQALGAQAEGATRHELDTPFGRPSDAIIESEWAGVKVFTVSRHGPGHLINPSQVPFRANIFALKQLGCTHVFASGAVGSLRDEFRPRDLVIPDQVIDRTSKRPSTFFSAAAVHVEFAEPFCPIMRQILIDAGQGASHGVHGRGCYVAMEGPSFSTRAESLMHRVLGGDLIGMTALPEAKLAREAEMAYALIALVTDYDCWKQKPADKSDPHVLLKEITGNLEAATQNAIALLKKAVELCGQRREQLASSPALNALELAIWSDKTAIDPEEVKRLAPLWGRHFESA